jgi:hypothetical protein
MGNLQSHPCFAVPNQASAEHRRKLQELERVERKEYGRGGDHQHRVPQTGRRTIVNDDPSKTAEYQDGDITILSRAPLIGTLELTDNDGEPIELQRDRRTAEALMAALTKFLLNGEGEDAPMAADRDASR